MIRTNPSPEKMSAPGWRHGNRTASSVHHLYMVCGEVPGLRDHYSNRSHLRLIPTNLRGTTASHQRSFDRKQTKPARETHDVFATTHGRWTIQYTLGSRHRLQGKPIRRNFATKTKQDNILVPSLHQQTCFVAGRGILAD